MSVSGISSSNFSLQQWEQEFQQLGEDLQAGNLSAAQSDFTTLQQAEPQGTASQSASSTSSPQNSNPIAQTFNQLAQDLQSGNLSAAQQDYSTLQQDLSQASQAHGHGHHHHHGGSGGGEISQLMSQLGQELSSGDLTTAQQTYNALAQDFSASSQGSGQVSGQASSQSGSGASSLSAWA